MLRALLPVVRAAAAFLLLCCSAVAHPGWGIVRDTQGNTYFTDLKQVWKLSPDGKLSVAVPHVHTHELVIDSRGYVYGEDLTYESAGDKWHDSYWRLSPGGRVETVVPDDLVVRGVSLLRDSAGSMYSVEQNNHTRARTVVLKRASDHTVEWAGGAFGRKDGLGAAAQFGSVGGMDVLPDGTIYLVDGDALRKIAPDATVTTLATGLDKPAKLIQGTGGLSNARSGVRFANGSVYVADYDNRRVLKLSADGKQRVTAYESPLGWGPTGIWVEGEDVYVLESRHPFGDSVRVVKARGGRGMQLAKVP